MLQNLLLDILPEREQSRIAHHCETVSLNLRDVLCEADTPYEYVWFPQSGVCSALARVDGGEAVEVGLVGREGMVGIPLVLGAEISPLQVIVQVPGSATRIPRAAFSESVLKPGGVLCTALLRYANLYLGNVAQTAACNRLHRIEQRLARWLLDLRDRTGSDRLPVTHEFLGLMVGAYRPSVTNALKAFEDRGVLAVKRGALDILDPQLLHAQSCECHDAIVRRRNATFDEIRALSAA